jgi:hypothetical protein
MSKGLLLGAAAGGLFGRSWGSAAIGAAAGYAIDKTAHHQPLLGGADVTLLGNDLEGGADDRGCTRQHTKKYTSRDSPPYPANNCAGQTRIGNDGELWHSKRASNGVHRWVKISGTSKRSPKKSTKRSAKKKSVKKRSQKRVHKK